METQQATPPTINQLNSRIKHDVTPDPSWIPTGEYHRDTAGNQWPVYIERRYTTTREAIRDADGQPMYHLAADGSRRRPMYQRVRSGSRDREFIYMPLGNGLTQKNYHFRPAPGELARLENERIEKSALTDLGRALKESGLGISDLVRSLKDVVGLQAEPAAPAPAQPTAPAPAPAPEPELALAPEQPKQPKASVKRPPEPDL